MNLMRSDCSNEAPEQKESKWQLPQRTSRARQRRDLLSLISEERQTFSASARPFGVEGYLTGAGTRARAAEEEEASWYFAEARAGFVRNDCADGDDLRSEPIVLT